MFYVPITTAIDNGKTVIGINMNSASGHANVAAFVSVFKNYAKQTSVLLGGFPEKLILTLWAAESGWGKSTLCANAQNWANISYTDANYPKENCGFYYNEGIKFATFLNAENFCVGFASFIKERKNPNSTASVKYREMLEYAKQNPDMKPEIFASFLTAAGFNGERSFSNLISSVYTTLSAFL